MKNKAKILPFVNLVSFILMICINIFANTLPINKTTTSEVSEKYFNLYTPASYTFSIWFVIYLFLAMFVIYSIIVFARNRESKEYIMSIGYLFSISCLLNSIWLICWHYEIILLSSVVIISLLYTLILIFLINYKNNNMSIKQSIFIKLPFALYLGWIISITMSNVTITLVKYNFLYLFSAQTWTMLVMGLLVVLSAIMLLKYGSYTICFVSMWSLLGILIRHVIVLDSQYMLVLIASSLYLIIMCFVLTIKLKRYT